MKRKKDKIEKNDKIVNRQVMKNKNKIMKWVKTHIW